MRPALLTARRRGILMLLIGNGLVQACLAATLAFTIKSVFDHHLIGDRLTASPELNWSGAWLIASALGMALARGRALVDAERLAQDYLTQLRQAYFDKLLTLAPRTLQRRSSGGLMLRFLGDLGALRLWIALGIARATVATVIVACALLAMVWINLALAGALAALLACAVLLALATGARLHTQTRAARKAMARAAANLSEKIAAMSVIQIFDQIGPEKARFARHAEGLKEAAVTRAKARALVRGVADASATLAAISVLAIGVYLAANGGISTGSVAAAMSIVAMLTGPLRDLGRAYEYWHGARISQDRIDEFFALTSTLLDRNNAIEERVDQGCINLCQATLIGAFADISTRVSAGSRVALIGPNGSGKSSLLKSIARLNELDSGQILVDGRDITSFALSSFRAAVCLAEPEQHLFKGSIDRNLKYRNRQADEAHIDQVRRQCGIDEIEAAIAASSSTRLLEGGANLSTGQRARLCLARALVGQPKILLLDEMDANLDEYSGSLLDQVIRTFDGTVIYITHRIERAAQADVLWYMEAGLLVESGPPAKVLSCAGPASLFSHATYSTPNRPKRLIRA